jgi:hypothetical protein
MKVFAYTRYIEKRYGYDLNRTPELCSAAIQENGCALEFVPEHLRRSELFLIAMQQKGIHLPNLVEFP